MPKRDLHRIVSNLLLGSDFDRIHMLKDSMSPVLREGHRRFFHDPTTNMIIALQSEDPMKAFAAGMLHDALDQFATKTKHKLKKIDPMLFLLSENSRRQR